MHTTSRFFRVALNSRWISGHTMDAACLMSLPEAGAGMATYSAIGSRVVNDDDRTGFPLCVHSANQYFSISADVTREDILRFFDGLKLTARDVKPQYNLQFRPVAWWLKFQTADDREKAKKVKNPRWGGRQVMFEDKSVREWQEGTFNHLVGESFGSSVVISRMASTTTDSDVASFFRNFHLAGNGVTLIQDPHLPNLRPEDQFKRAIVRLISPEEAQRSVRSLHRRYMRSARVTLKVVQ